MTTNETDTGAPDADAINALSNDAPFASDDEIHEEAGEPLTTIPRANVARIHELLDGMAMRESGFVAQLRALLPTT